MECLREPKIEAPTTLAETWVSWGNFLCIKYLLITSVKGSSYHLTAGTRSHNMPQYPQELKLKVMPYPYMSSTYTGNITLIKWAFSVQPPPPQRTHTHWPFKDPWALNGVPWPSWHRKDPDPAHFPLSDNIISSLNEGVSGLKAYVILPSTCNKVDREGFFFIKSNTFECNASSPKSKHLWMASLEKDFQPLCKLPEDTNWVTWECMSTANNSFQGE